MEAVAHQVVVSARLVGRSRRFFVPLLDPSPIPILYLQSLLTSNTACAEARQHTSESPFYLFAWQRGIPLLNPKNRHESEKAPESRVMVREIDFFRGKRPRTTLIVSLGMPARVPNYVTRLPSQQ